MSSARKIASCHANGAKSRGPVTPEGKARSSMNAYKHGLDARWVVLANEDVVAFNELLQSFRAELLPATELEERLVFNLSLAQWRLQRCWAAEAALIDHEMDHQAPGIEEKYESVDEPTRQALALRALCDQSRSLELFGRREARFRNIFSRSLNELLKLQAARRAAHTSADASPTASAGGPNPEPANFINEPNPANGHPTPETAPVASKASPAGAFVIDTIESHLPVLSIRSGSHRPEMPGSASRAAPPAPEAPPASPGGPNPEPPNFINEPNPINAHSAFEAAPVASDASRHRFQTPGSARSAGRSEARPAASRAAVW